MDILFTPAKSKIPRLIEFSASRNFSATWARKLSHERGYWNMEELGHIYERHAIFNSGYDVSIWFIQYLAHAAQVVQSLLHW